LKTNIPTIGAWENWCVMPPRLARFGGLKELRKARPHAIGQLFYYAVTPEAEPPDITPVLIDVSIAGDSPFPGPRQ